MKSAQSNPTTKRFVAIHAAKLVQADMVAGLGTGSTMVFLIEELARRVREEGLRFIGVPNSFQSRSLCCRLGLPIRDMEDVSVLDLTIDGADEVDPNLDLVKGGGAAHTREKITATMAKDFVVIVDESKLVERLGSILPIPVEVLPAGLSFVERALRELGGDPSLRLGLRKDGPVVTDNGQFVLDVRFARECDLRKADEAMHRIPGVIETGLFFGLAKKVLVGCGDGENLILRTLQRAE